MACRCASQREETGRDNGRKCIRHHTQKRESIALPPPPCFCSPPLIAFLLREILPPPLNGRSQLDRAEKVFPSAIRPGGKVNPIKKRGSHWRPCMSFHLTFLRKMKRGESARASLCSSKSRSFFNVERFVFFRINQPAQTLDEHKVDWLHLSAHV